MDQLWAPWRLAYASESQSDKREKNTCFICQGLNEDRDRDNYLVLRTEFTVTYLNRFPYNNGHLLVCPRAHKAELQELTRDEAHDIHFTLTRLIDALKRSIRPDGMNVGLNLGSVAGAGLPGHLHWHVVPRWNGDTNFMPVISDTKVIVQSLESLYGILTSEL